MFVLQQKIRQFAEDGQGLFEYALILLLVALAVIVVVALMGPFVGNLFSSVIEQL